MYDGIATVVGKTYTLKADVKLVGSSSVFGLGFQMGGNVGSVAQTFTASDGLNTSTFTTLSFSAVAGQTTSYWNLGRMPFGTGTQASAGDVYHLQNVSVVEDPGVLNLNGVSTAPTYIDGPAHWISTTFNNNWVDVGTHSILTSQGTAYDMYQATVMTIGETYTLKCDVKLVGSSSVFVLGIEQTGYHFGQTFTAADGLNTSTYTTLTLSRVAGQSNGYWEIGHINWYLSTNPGNPQPSAGDVYHIKNVSFYKENGVQITGDLNISGTMTAADITVDHMEINGNDGLMNPTFGYRQLFFKDQHGSGSGANDGWWLSLIHI